MFIDRQKLEKVYLDEFTKIGNLFDTINVGYTIIDRFALLAYGLNSKSILENSIIVDSKNKGKILRTLFKLNYIISTLDDGCVTIQKTVKAGDLLINICFGEMDNKKVSIINHGNQIFLPPKILSQERREIRASKSGKGYFRVAPLEVLYILRMNNKQESFEELELIKSSSKMDIDKLFKLFELNGLV